MQRRDPGRTPRGFRHQDHPGIRGKALREALPATGLRLHRHHPAADRSEAADPVAEVRTDVEAQVARLHEAGIKLPERGLFPFVLGPRAQPAVQQRRQQVVSDFLQQHRSQKFSHPARRRQSLIASKPGTVPPWSAAARRSFDLGRGRFVLPATDRLAGRSAADRVRRSSPQAQATSCRRTPCKAAVEAEPLHWEQGSRWQRRFGRMSPQISTVSQPGHSFSAIGTRIAPFDQRGGQSTCWPGFLPSHAAHHE